MNDTDIDNRHVEVDRGAAMVRLLNNEDFKSVFEKHYLEDWAITQVQNIAVYRKETREAVMEEMLARSIFSIFCSDVIAKGNIAKDDLAEEREDEIYNGEENHV